MQKIKSGLQRVVGHLRIGTAAIRKQLNPVKMVTMLWINMKTQMVVSENLHLNVIDGSAVVLTANYLRIFRLINRPVTGRLCDEWKKQPEGCFFLLLSCS